MVARELVAPVTITRMIRRDASLVAATSAAFCLLLAFALDSAEAAPGGDTHHFMMRVVGTGSASADFGEDRKEPGLITASGVDGKESASWRWEVLAVASSVGSGPLVTRAHVERARGVLTASVLSYGIQMGKLGEEPLCTNRQGTTTILSNDGRGGAARKSGSGEFIHDGFAGIREGGLIVASPELSPLSCFHGSPEFGHGLQFVNGTGRDETRVPRGAFNPRFDRSYSETYTDAASEDRSHGGDLNSAHTFAGNSKVELQVEAVSERRFNRLVKKYQHVPVGLGSGETEYHDPPPST
jgi:hypothetical protein